MDTQELDKNILKAHIQKTDMMIEMLEVEEKDLRKRETEIVCDLEALYRKKEELLTLLSGSDFSASLINEDWDIRGTLSLKTQILDSAAKAAKEERQRKFEEDWKRKNKLARQREKSRSKTPTRKTKVKIEKKKK
jgi:hypothetical protein